MNFPFLPDYDSEFYVFSLDIKFSKEAKIGFENLGDKKV